MTIPYKNKNLLLLNKITFHCMMNTNLNEDQRKKGEPTPPNITYSARMEKCDNIIYVWEVDKSVDTEKYVIQRNINENKTETSWNTSEEMIYECPGDASPVVTEDCVNEEHEDSNQNYLIW